MPASAADRTNIRREAIGDSANTTLLPDADIDYYFDGGGGGCVLLTAALCCEMLAGKYGGTQVPIASLGDGVSFDQSVFPAQLRQRARELRARYVTGDSGVAAGVSMAVQAVWADAAGVFDSSAGEFST